ncbi:DUF2695 domain-containing protein [Amycolatopsis cihanbeyliensis]|uniref:Uncharacterized protein DUF2695 n=1 Tax=Amycolatopsis cihanbeyliensis TaxID=1128664 RepID=A0A542DGA4_AMYCI|nr:DUF2695 domain-containing protein [Amycolatopsis cihanbeyliensis]TQJ02106.1 uncharacterized protein DUF2695 [Amycolatopsis cihanbeyliensis]
MRGETLQNIMRDENTTAATAATEAEAYLEAAGGELTRRLERECLPCYVSRMLDEFGCDNTLRWAKHWRDACAPDGRGLERELQDRGGFCDCGIGYNVYPDHMLHEGDKPPPACAGVFHRGSTAPCSR